MREQRRWARSNSKTNVSSLQRQKFGPITYYVLAIDLDDGVAEARHLQISPDSCSEEFYVDQLCCVSIVLQQSSSLLGCLIVSVSWVGVVDSGTKRGHGCSWSECETDEEVTRRTQFLSGFDGAFKVSVDARGLQVSNTEGLSESNWEELRGLDGEDVRSQLEKETNFGDTENKCEDDAKSLTPSVVR